MKNFTFLLVLMLVSAQANAQLFDDDDLFGGRWESAVHTGKVRTVGPNQLICEYKTLLGNKTLVVRVKDVLCPIFIKYDWERNQWKRDGL